MHYIYLFSHYLPFNLIQIITLCHKSVNDSQHRYNIILFIRLDYIAMVDTKQEGLLRFGN